MLFYSSRSFILQRCLSVMLLLIVTTVLADDDDSNTEKQSTATLSHATLKLDEKTQALSGLQTSKLEAKQFYSEVLTLGKAISIQPLLALRHRYLTALTENNQSLAKLKHAEQNKKRQEALYQQGVSAKRAVQETQLAWQSDKAIVTTQALQTQAIMEEAQLTWGKTLTNWLLTPDNAKLNGFLSGNFVLLHISVPSGKTGAKKPSHIYVDTTGQRNKATQATLISEAPQTDTPTQQQSYFFQGQGQFIKPGMRISAWLPEEQSVLKGLLIPKSAVIWLLDQLFVYVKTDETTFIRRPILDYSLMPEGYFTATGFEPGEKIVTTGAQMLLSEEQRQQIPDEDD